jgi:glycerol kinase
MVSIEDVLKNADARLGQIAPLGITCQRETTILWDRETGTPV